MPSSATAASATAGVCGRWLPEGSRPRIDEDRSGNRPTRGGDLSEVAELRRRNTGYAVVAG
jgi:hypothetical protein